MTAGGSPSTGWLRRLAAQGTAVIFSTHYLEEASEACDTLVILDHGHRVAAGPLGDLLAANGDTATVIHLSNGGPAHTVPSLGSLFALMGTASTGFWFFREHGWGTWDRLRIAPIRPFEIVAG
ncbi:hypothetical protein [Candidatus Poriferisodalis sp.]|uniref:hypothetical protein n=1 Tax=Candidatus Poriferisodalis sp. TaxID=3101277 RepID=UPI003C6FB19D